MTIVVPGYSGTSYEFQIYEINDISLSDFPIDEKIGGVFIYAKLVNKNDLLLLKCETKDDLSTKFTMPPNSTHILILQIDTRIEREYIKGDISANFDFKKD